MVEWIDILMQQSLSLCRLCDVHNKVDRKRRSSKLWNRRANNKKVMICLCNNESKGVPVIWHFLSTYKLTNRKGLEITINVSLKNITSEASCKCGNIISFGAKIVIFLNVLWFPHTILKWRDSALSNFLCKIH